MFEGSYVALVTPFNDDLSINFDKITELIEWHITKGTDGFIICGTTGEATTMSSDEKFSVIEHTLKVVDKRVPVVAGTGSNNTAAAIEFSNRVETLGVDGLLIISPYYLKTNAEGLYQHFVEIANNVRTPIILYNVPGRTAVNIPADIVLRLSMHDNIVAVKEASGDLKQIKQICNNKPEGFSVISGSDELNTEILELGGTGVISVFANVAPMQCKEIVSLCAKGNYVEARQLQKKYLDLINTLFIEPNPIPVKAALNSMGIIVGGYRLPLWEMSSENLAVLNEEMKVLFK